MERDFTILEYIYIHHVVGLKNTCQLSRTFPTFSVFAEMLFYAEKQRKLSITFEINLNLFTHIPPTDHEMNMFLTGISPKS